jgi:hypothetical protein
MDTKPPGKSAGREIVERAAEAGLNFVPVVGNSLAITFVTALNWKLNQRREEWLEELAKAVQELGERVDGMEIEALTENPLFVDAVVTATRTVEHTHRQDKLAALRNAVLNSAMPGAPDADSQAILFSMLDRFTGSHLRLLTMWDDPPEWFRAHAIAPPQAAMAGSRTQTVEAGLPELRDRRDFYLQLAEELRSAGLMTAQLSGMVSPTALMDRLTSRLGRQLVEFIRQPADMPHSS